MTDMFFKSIFFTVLRVICLILSFLLCVNVVEARLIEPSECNFPKDAFIYPPQSQNPVSASEFVSVASDLDMFERDSLVLQLIQCGNIPEKLRNPICIVDTLDDAAGNRHEVIICVFRDVMSVGTDDDCLRIPMLPKGAQQVVGMLGANLPTRKISYIIHHNSQLKFIPHPMRPDYTMSTLKVFVSHDSILDRTCRRFPNYRAMLLAGHKKDIVIANGMALEPDRLFIYGWHYPDGDYIQPLSRAHNLYHVDYSHGVRLVSDKMLIDGKLYSLKSVLKDPLLYKLLSDEEGPMEVTEYVK